MSTPDRLPPYSEEYERGVLGCALMDFGEQTMDLCDRYEVTADTFYVPAHRTVFDAIRAMRNEGKVIDALSVSAYMQQQGTIEMIGGAMFIDRLIDETPTATHAEYYVSEARKLHKLRVIIETSRTTEAKCFAGQHDPDSILDGFEAQLSGLSMTEIDKEQDWQASVKESADDMERIIKDHRGLNGLSTGFADLDRATLGMERGELIILAARPSHGKTSLALNIAEHVATGQGDPDHEAHPVAVFSLEMSQSALTKRMMCGRAGVPWFKFVRGYIGPEAQGRLVEAAGYAMKLPIHCDDTGGLDVQQLRIRAKRLRKRKGIELIIIDYLQLLNAEARSSHGRQLETAYISSQLKAMAKELKVPVLALSQLSRIKDDRLEIPRLHHLRDSGAIEQDADKVVFIRRPCMYEHDDNYEDKSRADVTVAKNRNGPVGRIVMNFDEGLTRFSDRSKMEDPI